MKIFILFIYIAGFLGAIGAVNMEYKLQCETNDDIAFIDGFAYGLFWPAFAGASYFSNEFFDADC